MCGTAVKVCSILLLYSRETWDSLLIRQVRITPGRCLHASLAVTVKLTLMSFRRYSTPSLWKVSRWTLTWPLYLTSYFNSITLLTMCKMFLGPETTEICWLFCHCLTWQINSLSVYLYMNIYTRIFIFEYVHMNIYICKTVLSSLFVVEFKFDGFSVDMTRSMVAMRDVSLLTYLLIYLLTYLLINCILLRLILVKLM